MTHDAEGIVREELLASAHVKEAMAAATALVDATASAAGAIHRCLKAGGKVLLFGNGGSAADSQHLAAEFIGRFSDVARSALPAIALTTDSSVLTALSNDYGFDVVFERQVEALARPGDVVIALTTSGSSQNVVRGIRAARAAGATTILMTGANGAALSTEVDHGLVVPSEETSRIQEGHITLGHALCRLVEAEGVAT